MKIEPCPVCGAPAQPAIAEGNARCPNGDCPMLTLPVPAWNRLSLALALIEDITTHVDSPLWAQENKWGVNEGWLHLRAMLADFQEATK